ncbi:MAG: type II secretion system protein GspG [Planctomycetes bacterium]|nr:type II secretion system protein GspG [Planctomycetota bacterium]
MFALLAPVLAFIGLQVPAQSPEPAPVPVPASIEDLIPSEAQAVLRIASLERLRAIVMPILHSADPEMPPIDPLPMLAAEMGLEAPWEKIDATQPVIIAVAMSAETQQPEVTFLFDARVPADFTADERVRSSAWHCKALGNHVVLSMGTSVGALAVDAPLRRGLAYNDIVLRVDCRALMSQFGDEFLQSFESEADAAVENANSPGEGRIVQELLDGTREAVGSMETFTLGVKQNGARTRIVFELSGREGSALVSVPKVDIRPLASLARVISADAPLAMLSAMDFAPLAARFQEWFEAIAAELPPQDSLDVSAMMRDATKAYSVMGACNATEVRMDEAGIAVTYAQNPPDHKAFVDAHIASMSVLKPVGPTPVTVAGHNAQRVTFDIRGLIESTVKDAQAQLPVEFDEVMRKLFGGDGFVLHYAPVGKEMVISMGREAALSGALERMQASASSAAGNELLAMMGNLNPGFSLRMNPVKLVDGVTGLIRAVGAPMPDLEEELHAALAACPPILMAGGLDERTWRFAIDADLVRIVDVFSKLPEMSGPEEDFDPIRSELMFELSNLQHALENYADDHGGEYPKSLLELLTRSAEGYEYISEAGELIDPWNRPYVYSAPANAGEAPRVLTLGADGKPGGTGLDRDQDSVTIEEEPSVEDSVDPEEH